MIPKCSLLAAVHQNPSIQPYFRLFSAILTCYSKKSSVSKINSGVSENEPPQRTTRCGFIHNHTKRKSQILVTNDMNAVSLKLLDNCSPFFKNISLSLTHNVSFIIKKKKCRVDCFFASLLQNISHKAASITMLARQVNVATIS